MDRVPALTPNDPKVTFARPAASQDWLRFLGTVEDALPGQPFVRPRAFLNGFRDVLASVGASPDWQAWWSPMAEYPIELMVVFQGERPLMSQKTGHRKCTGYLSATLVFSYDECRSLTAAEAPEVLGALMSRLAKTYRLGAHPAVP